MSTEIEKLRMEVEALRRRTVPNCEGLEVEYITAQQKADAAYRATGSDGSPPHLLGESLVDYRQRLLNGVKSKSPTWRNASLPRGQDILDAIEPQIFRDAVASLRDNANYAHGQLKEVVERDSTGRRITKFYGDNSVTWGPFQPKVNRYVTGFSK